VAQTFSHRSREAWRHLASIFVEVLAELDLAGVRVVEQGVRVVRDHLGEDVSSSNRSAASARQQVKALLPRGRDEDVRALGTPTGMKRNLPGKAGRGRAMATRGGQDLCQRSVSADW